MQPTPVLRSYGPRNVPGLLRLKPSEINEAVIGSLDQIGVGFDSHEVARLMAAYDAIQGPTFAATIPTPLQFLQTILPGVVETVTRARLIDTIVGTTRGGNWEDEEIIQQVAELLGKAVPYTDLGNIPLSSWNTGFERRSVIRLEEGLEVGKLEQARTGRFNMDSTALKRRAAIEALAIGKNEIAWNGFNAGSNRTYGFLNDPGLPAISNLPNGASGSPLWSTKTFQEITRDLRTWFAALRTQAGGLIDPKVDPLTLALPLNAVDYLTTTTDMGVSVLDWLERNYPRVRVVAAPELDTANGGASLGVLYADSLGGDGSTDDGSAITQLVIAEAQLVGSNQGAKTLVEVYSNAFAGILVKRPYLIARRSGM